MLINAHHAFADHLEESGRRLADGGARILPIWAYMHSATHDLNALLHELGVTAARNEAASNRAGVYISLDDEEKRSAGGDVIHSDMPPVTYPAGILWDLVLADLQHIEQVASASLRSAWDPVDTDVDDIHRHLRRVRLRIADLRRSHE